MWRSPWLYGNEDSDDYYNGTRDNTQCIGSSVPTDWSLSSQLDNTSTVDCNDSDSSINPYYGWYIDADGDGEGDSTFTVIEACSPPDDGNTYVNNNDDCDDSNANVNTTGEEVCNHIDDNCDSNVDEDTSLASPAAQDLWVTLYYDEDGDDYGRNSQQTFQGCAEVDAQGDGHQYATAGNDCNDINPNIWVNRTTYPDNDGDGVGAGSSLVQCTDGTAPTGYSLTSTDCDDVGTEGAKRWKLWLAADGEGGYRDADGDGVTYGPMEDVCGDDDGIVNYTNLPDHWRSSQSSPVDCAASDASTWVNTTQYRDTDGDGDTVDHSETKCIGSADPAGWTSTSSSPDFDCNDYEYDINHSATEICTDGVDNNCDGESDYDKSNGQMGDSSCRVYAENLAVSQTTINEGVYVDASCDASVEGINSLKCGFRRNPATRSNRIRPPIPTESGHPIQGIPAGHSGRFRPPLRGWATAALDN